MLSLSSMPALGWICHSSNAKSPSQTCDGISLTSLKAPLWGRIGFLSIVVFMTSRFPVNVVASITSADTAQREWSGPRDLVGWLLLVFLLLSLRRFQVINSGTIRLWFPFTATPNSYTQIRLMPNLVSLLNANSSRTIEVDFCCTMRLKRNLICKYPNILDAGLCEGSLACRRRHTRHALY